MSSHLTLASIPTVRFHIQLYMLPYSFIRIRVQTRRGVGARSRDRRGQRTDHQNHSPRSLGPRASTNHPTPSHKRHLQPQMGCHGHAVSDFRRRPLYPHHQRRDIRPRLHAPRSRLHRQDIHLGPRPPRYSGDWRTRWMHPHLGLAGCRAAERRWVTHACEEYRSCA